MAICINNELFDAYGWDFKWRQLSKFRQEFLIKSVQEGFQCSFYLHPQTDESLIVITNPNDYLSKTLNTLYIDVSSTEIWTQEINVSLTGQLPTGLATAKALNAYSYDHNR